MVTPDKCHPYRGWHAVSRNNVLQVRQDNGYSVSENRSNTDNDFDYDLYNGRIPKDQEAHGVRGQPIYAPGAGFDGASKAGRFQLAPNSPGAGQGLAILNFNAGFTGPASDMGVHQRGTPPMQFGVGVK